MSVTGETLLDVNLGGVGGGGNLIFLGAGRAVSFAGEAIALLDTKICSGFVWVPC